MNKKEKKQTKTLQRLAKAHNELLNLKGAESLEGKDDVILKALNFVGRITSFGTIEILEELMQKHPHVRKLITDKMGESANTTPEMGLLNQMLRDLDGITGVMKSGFDEALRNRLGYILMDLRKHMTARNLEISMSVINVVRELDAVTQAKLDIEDALSMIGRNKPSDLIEASIVIDKEELINLILERK